MVRTMVLMDLSEIGNEKEERECIYYFHQIH